MEKRKKVAAKIINKKILCTGTYCLACIIL